MALNDSLICFHFRATYDSTCKTRTNAYWHIFIEGFSRIKRMTMGIITTAYRILKEIYYILSPRLFFLLLFIFLYIYNFFGGF